MEGQSVVISPRVLKRNEALERFNYGWWLDLFLGFLLAYFLDETFS